MKIRSIPEKSRVLKKPYYGFQYDIIAISVSTGGPGALDEILTRIPANIPVGIVIVQHMSEGFISNLAQWLDGHSQIKVKIAGVGDRIKSGVALIAPSGFHLEVGEEGVAYLRRNQKDTYIPSADLMMKSVAKVYGARAIGIILTGLGKDGVEGIKAIKEVGGKTIAQDEDSSVIYDMPKTAINNGYIDRVLPLERIAGELLELL